MGTQYTVTQHGKPIIHRLIRDITLDVPDVKGLGMRVNEILIKLSPKVMKQYEKLEKEFFVELDEVQVEVFNVAALSNKLRQFCNGAVYLEDGKTWKVAHNEKLDALEEVIDEAGSPVLCGYQYKHDVEQIKTRFKDRCVHLHSRMTETQAIETVAKWNQREIEVLIGHPASIGHGLNLQFGSHTIAFFGLPWDLEQYLQFIGRLKDRHGQDFKVIVHHLMCINTVEMLMGARLTEKEEDQTGLRAAINAYRKGKSYGFM
jgi:SNF2 family DNA or RNA helicase